MANYDLSATRKKEEQVFTKVKRHSEKGFDETEKRTTGRGRIGSISFDEADELFRSWIDENNWPYDAILFDPRIFTFIFEKTSRLISGKPRGRLIPREGADVLAAKINNSLLEYQWDMATHGGPMLSKWSLMDINARKYGASFAICKWRYELDTKGKVVFDGPEMQVLNNRDIAHDLTATSIESCNWFQVRQYVTFQELEQVNDYARAKPIYKNLDKLRDAIGRETTEGGGGDGRGQNWQSRNRSISHLETDPVGKDDVFKTVEIITEYRRDRWITFAPRHGVILRDIENPYQNYEIPITMLRYYMIDDDLYGMSEIEPIKGTQKAINAILSQYVDEINQKLYSPIAIGPGVRQHTLEWGKGARWIMNNPLSDFRLVESKSNAAQYFQTTYSVLVSSMQNALGESSLGTSNVQPFQTDKTATEVKALQVQRNARDNYNQIFLAEAIKRQMMLWHSMNQLLLFSDPKKQTYIIRIVGDDAMDFFIQKGLGATTIPDEAFSLMKEQGTISEAAFRVPQYPVNMGTESEPDIQSKLQLEDNGKSGQLIIQPEDLKGTFDFSVDVETMAVNADEEKRNSRQLAVQLLATNPNVLMLLNQEQYKPKFKELFVSWLQDMGFIDAEKYFEKGTVQLPGQQGAPGQSGMPGMSAPTPPMGGAPQASPAADININPPTNQAMQNLLSSSATRGYGKQPTA
jgi:hypothetical protein